MMAAILILPAIPWLIVGLVTLIGMGLVVAIHPQKTTGKTLGVLGMVQAGKSRFLSNLGLFPFSEAATNIKEYQSHILELNDRKIKIQSGEDIGGNIAIKHYYNQWIEEKDITVFIFDGPRFLTETSYEKDVKRRLHFIYNKAKVKYIDDSDFTNIVVIVSHPDQFKGKKEKMLEDIIGKVQNRKYCALLKSNVFAADLRSKEQVMEIANKIF